MPSPAWTGPIGWITWFSETFSANLDWPHNNVMIWQMETGAPFRFIFFDGDGCFTSMSFKTMENALGKQYDSEMIAFFGNEGLGGVFSIVTASFARQLSATTR